MLWRAANWRGAKKALSDFVKNGHLTPKNTQTTKVVYGKSSKNKIFDSSDRNMLNICSQTLEVNEIKSCLLLHAFIIAATALITAC